jgi:hypothetical protein
MLKPNQIFSLLLKEKNSTFLLSFCKITKRKVEYRKQGKDKSMGGRKDGENKEGDKALNLCI